MVAIEAAAETTNLFTVATALHLDESTIDWTADRKTAALSIVEAADAAECEFSVILGAFALEG